MDQPGPAIGEMAPDFSLPDEQGNPLRLSELRGRPVILYFYPRDDTSGCTAQACGFRDRYPEIEARDARVLGVSPDGQASHLKFKTKHDLPFTLLVDADHQVAEAYGAWGEKSMYGRRYEGVIRSHFVIDASGRIVDAQRKVSPANSVAGAIAALEAQR
ncbi:MAG: thioredoxin-dependent thiol peroxidase [Chloroflexi bacterium]|nr:thioredoxin-dependent thiol peroxidase [Chloroflexota bacterium]